MANDTVWVFLQTQCGPGLSHNIDDVEQPGEELRVTLNSINSNTEALQTIQMIVWSVNTWPGWPATTLIAG